MQGFQPCRKLLGLLGSTVLGMLLPVASVAGQGVAVGYTQLIPNGGNSVPAGSAVFSYRNSEGVLVSEAGVAAVPILKRGRLFVGAGARTGVAIVNPQTVVSAMNLRLRDSAGKVVAESTLTLEPGRHTARFVDELFTNVPSGFQGSVTFESLSGHGAITLRESHNGYGEPLYTTLPVVDLDGPKSSEPLTFPHLAAGGGYQTEVVLINGSGALSRGRIRFFKSDGFPLLLNLNGLQTADVGYELEPDGVFRAELAGGDSVEVGYALLTPEIGSAPAGSIIFKLSAGGQLLSETGVGATPPTKAAKISIDNVGRLTGFALANPGLLPADVRFSLQDRYGILQLEVSQVIPPGGHFARLAGELFPLLSAGFSGLMEIRSTVPVVPITLQITTNTRGVGVLTTLPVADLTVPAVRGDMIFPQVVIGGGFSTRFVLIATDVSEFTLSHHTSDSRAWALGPNGESSVAFKLGAGEGLRSFPSGETRITSLTIRDPITNLPTTEISVTAGSSARPLVLVVDALGNARDDLPVTYASLNLSVATVSSAGLVTGVKPGFSTLAVSVGDRVATATISVVTVEQSKDGFATGVTQNAAGTVFVATEDQTVLKVETPLASLYAGTHRQAGFRNDVRLLSQFRAPSYLSVDRSNGRLYVSDSGNHAIRVLPVVDTDSVVTLSGRGNPGFADGGSASALFNTPKGVALDNAGFLWVVDQGNHAIRRINLGTGEVRTVAGTPGQSGNRDGTGSAALFDTPTGIAIEPEGIVQQLLREARGDPPPPVRVVVADTKNGIIRRITESGEVSTVRSGTASAISSTGGKGYNADALAAPLTFNSPTGIAVSALGTIYVTESGLGQIRSILPTGEVLAVSASGSFDNPNSIVIGKDGEIIIGSTGTPLTAIRASAPVITSINPAAVDTRAGQLVEVRGANFEPDAVLVIEKIPIPITFHDTTRISFVTPVLPAGQTSISVTTRGGVGLAAFRVGPAISLVFGSIVQGEIAQAGEIDRIPFTANQGDRVLLTLVYTSGFNPVYGVYPRASITSPSGKVLAAWNATAEREFTLTEPGTYTVDVFANNFVNTGKYNLGLERLDAVTAVDGAVGFGAIRAATIAMAGENGLFTFTGNANDRVLLTLVHTGGFNAVYGIYPRASIITPSGQPLGTFWDGTAEREVTLTETGTYLVRVRANDLTSAGTYRLGLERLTPLSQVDGTFIFGTIFKGTITQPGQQDLITFSGNANDRVLLTLVHTGGFNAVYGIYPRASIVTPSGQALGTSWDGTAEREVTLTETGTYLVRLRANDLTMTGTYSLGLERISPLTAVDITFGFGTTVSGTITNSAQQDLITFSANANDNILLALVTTGGFNPVYGIYARASITTPSGQVLGTWDGGQRTFTLPETGTYLVRARANNLTDTGTYNLSLIKLGN